MPDTAPPIRCTATSTGPRLTATRATLGMSSSTRSMATTIRITTTSTPLRPTGIEWEDDMVDVNRITTPANTRWKLIDRDTGAANHAIDCQFRVGDKVKLRLVNELDSDYPMHHPLHIHGAGRFVVVARDGVPEENLLLEGHRARQDRRDHRHPLDVTNPGVWMAHCHIAEDHESGMRFIASHAPQPG
jgi:FtsP/CotA-like multicopper oxidase with cupredoxin domain